MLTNFSDQEALLLILSLTITVMIVFMVTKGISEYFSLKRWQTTWFIALPVSIFSICLYMVCYSLFISRITEGDRDKIYVLALAVMFIWGSALLGSMRVTFIVKEDGVSMIHDPDY